MSSLFPDRARTHSIIPALLLFLCAAPGTLRAQDVTVLPGLALKQEYSDNVEATTVERKSDYITTVSPSLSLSRKSETAQGTATGGVNALYYLDGAKSDSIGYFLKGSGSYAVTPLVRLSTDLGYVRDNSASALDAATGQLIGSRTERQNYRGGVRRELSETSAARLDLAYGRDDYASPSYFDTKYWVADAALEYRLEGLLPSLVLAPQAGYRQDRTSLSQVDTVSATLGASFALNELWNLTLAGGAHFTRSDFRDPFGPEETHDEVGGLGKAVLGYSAEATSGNLSVSHALAPASGKSGATQVTSGSLTMYRRFTGALSGNVTGGYTWNRSAAKQFAAQAIDERSKNFSASLLYAITDTRDLTLEARYSYHNTDYHRTGAEMDQNVVMLQLTWRHEMFR